LLSVFLAISGLSGTRYFGMFFIFFIAALWLAWYDGVLIFPEGNVSPFKKIASQLFIYLILINQLFTGLYLYYKDYRYPFSQAKNAVGYLKANHLDTQPLAFEGYNAGPAFSAYLGRKIFYLDIDQYGSFCIWKRAYFPKQRRSLTSEILASQRLSSFKQFILVTNTYITANDSNAYNFNKLAAFEDAIIDGENYFVYRVTKK
jgi:hypothetical protein